MMQEEQISLKKDRIDQHERVNEINQIKISVKGK
jgi:hypothetical protein